MTTTILKYALADLPSRYFECNKEWQKGLVFYKVTKEIVTMNVPWFNFWNEFDLTLINLKNPTLQSDKPAKIMKYLKDILIEFEPNESRTSSQQLEHESKLNKKLIDFFDIASKYTMIKVSYFETESIYID